MPMVPPPSPAGHGYAGVFIVFEGGDGAGKSTQLGLLATAVREAGHDVRTTREPGGTEVGAQIRQVVLHGAALDPRAEALLFAADRAHHVSTVVRPALQAGEVVICDRYADSSIAYQGIARDLDAGDIRSLSEWATGGLWPDLTVVLDVDPAVGRERRGAEGDRVESEADAFHQRVREGFLDLATEHPERYLTLDATQPADVLHDAVVARVGELVDLEAVGGG